MLIPSLIVLGKARRLDRTMPGWAERIRIDRLDLTTNSSCVLGQLYGDYCNAPLFLGGMILCPLIFSPAFCVDLLPGERKFKTWVRCIEQRQMRARAKIEAQAQAQAQALYVPVEWERELARERSLR